MTKCEYIHPIHYKGIRISSTGKPELIARLMVETNCLMCEEFSGTEHDFEKSGCLPFFTHCPKWAKHFSIVAPKQFIKYKVEGEQE